MSDILTILIASLIGISCSILGCFLVLRKMALLTDAISHAVLPGIVIAFLLSQSRDTFFMVLGAGTFGFFTSFLVEWLQKKGRIQADASIGIVFTFFFAVGIILVTQYTQKIDLDQECVLYGDLLHVTLDVWRLADGTNVGPKTLWLLTPILLVIIMFVTIFYRTLQIITFDIIFAQSIGIPIALFHYTLTALVSFTTVTSFESVGAILVVAFFIIPPATAQLLTKCLRHMIILSAIFSILARLLGYYLSIVFNSSSSGMIVVVSGLLFLLVFLLAPRRGNFTQKKLSHATTFSS